MKDWLIEDATLGPKALRKKLKEHHGIDINSKRVYMGKLLALKELYGDWIQALIICIVLRHKLKGDAPVA